ncbi:helix-turn-helix domain-containing protein [Parvibaculum sp.]|uniref:AraC-like ligand-binding domain-containing protein n=1 Tax=Parvibaculum sp. TaxID=2024848 RepID=UPI00320C3E72
MAQTPGGWQNLCTETVPPRDRLAYWHEATNRLFPPTRLSRPSHEGFYGRVSWLEFGEVTLANIVSTSLDVTRSEREITSDDDRWYEINVQIEGTSAFRQDGREVAAGPRSLVLYDSRRPYEMRFKGPYRQLSLKLPRETLRDRVPNIDALIARNISADGIPGRFFYDFAAALCDAPEGIPGFIASRLEQHTLDLLATALLGVGTDASATVNRLSQLDRIKAHILERLDQPTLTPRSIAEAHQISLRHLYELFEAEDEQVARWIQTHRLDRIRRDLADPLKRGWPINTIALSCGFKDFSHFSRRFRRQYGVSPREYRNRLSH